MKWEGKPPSCGFRTWKGWKVEGSAAPGGRGGDVERRLARAGRCCGGG